MSHAFVLRCAQGQLLAVHLGGPGPLWMRFLDAVEQQHLAKDARFAALEDRVRNWSALLDALAPAFSERSREEWMRRLVADDLPADRKSVVWGKSVEVRVDLGGCRIHK